MDLFSLVATLGLDSTNFITGISSASDLFQNFARAVIGFGKDAVQTGMNFDKGMSSVQAVLGQQEGTVENMNRLRAFALEQARDSIFTAEQTADAYYYMGMAGWKSEQMLKGLPGIMALAAVSGENLATVSDIVTDSITAFGLTADDVQHYVDVLAQAATNANTNVYLMGETFKYVAPIAGALGADADDVAVSIGLMANAGIKGSMAGTALRQIFTRISTNAGETKKDLGALTIITEKLGVQFRDSSGKMRDWSDVISETREAWKGLDDETQIYYAKQIASERGMSGWLAIMNATEEDVRKLTAAIEEAGGAAQTMSEVRLDNLAGDVEMLYSSLDVLKVAIYDDVKGPMREVVQWAADALDDITDAINENGLAGGIEVLGNKIEEAGEKFAPMIEALGAALGPMVSELIENVLPQVEEAGMKLGGAIITGAKNALFGGENPIAKALANNFLSSDVLFQGKQSAQSIYLPIDTERMQQEISTQIQEAIDKAKEEGKSTVAIEGQIFWVDTPPEEIAKALGLEDVGKVAGEQIATDIGSQVEAYGQTMSENLRENIGDAGAFGGSAMTGNIDAQLSSESPRWTGVLADALGAAGDPAGSQIANAIGSALIGRNFSINVRANVSGLPTHHNASAMTAGRIYTNPTIFGYANGAYQVAGDAGPEAVIGTHSLAQLITNAVSRGQTFAVPRAAQSTPGAMTVVLQIGKEELGRVVTPIIEAEQQRRGVRLSTGG